MSLEQLTSVGLSEFKAGNTPSLSLPHTPWVGAETLQDRLLLAPLACLCILYLVYIPYFPPPEKGCVMQRNAQTELGLRSAQECGPRVNASLQMRILTLMNVGNKVELIRNTDLIETYFIKP